jgi:hypothetical protein
MRIILQESHRLQLLRENAAVSERARQLADTLDEQQLTWRPPDGGWTVGQVFDHLCVANDSYLVRMRSLIGDRPPPSGLEPGFEWRPTLMGRFLVNSFRSTRKLPVPRIYRPAAEPRPNVIPEFLDRQDQMNGLLERSATLRWTELRIGSPVTRLIRVNLGDCFTIMVAHAERHLRQIDRLQAGAQAAYIGGASS